MSKSEKDNLENAAKCLESAISLLGQVSVTGWDQINNIMTVGKFLNELHIKTSTALSQIESPDVKSGEAQN